MKGKSVLKTIIVKAPIALPFPSSLTMMLVVQWWQLTKKTAKTCPAHSVLGAFPAVLDNLNVNFSWVTMPQTTNMVMFYSSVHWKEGVQKDFDPTKTRLQRHSVSLAWRLDQEMRRWLILHETGFTRQKLFTSYFIYVATFYLFLNWFSTHVSDTRKYACGHRLYARIN